MRTHSKLALHLKLGNSVKVKSKVEFRTPVDEVKKTTKTPETYLKTSTRTKTPLLLMKISDHSLQDRRLYLHPSVLDQMRKISPTKPLLGHLSAAFRSKSRKPRRKPTTITRKSHWKHSMPGRKITLHKTVPRNQMHQYWFYEVLNTVDESPLTSQHVLRKAFSQGTAPEIQDE